MVYNENGIMISKGKNVCIIGEEVIDMRVLESVLTEAAPYNSDKFKKIMDDIKSDIEACDNDNIKGMKDKGSFLSEKIKRIITNINAVIGISASMGGVAILQSNAKLALLLSGLGAATLILASIIESKPSKERHLLDTANEAIKYFDSIASNKKLPDSVREKAMEQARRLAVKVKKCELALQGERWFDQYDWGISSDILFQNRMVYFADDITNTKYEENKTQWDNVVKQMNTMFPKILKDVAKQIKKDYKNVETVAALSESDIVNALGCYAASMNTENSRIFVIAMCCEKDAYDNSYKDIPVVLGKVIKIDIRYNDGKITWEYYETKMKSYQ